MAGKYHPQIVALWLALVQYMMLWVFMNYIVYQICHCITLWLFNIAMENDT